MGTQLRPDAPESWSQGKAVLLAASLASDANIASLQPLVRLGLGHELDPETLLRILLSFLPESVEPAAYVGILRDLESGQSKQSSLDEHEDLPAEWSTVADLSHEEVKKGICRLRLVKLRHTLHDASTKPSLVEQFIFHRSHRIESETGLVHFAAELVKPFLASSAFLRDWFVGIVWPLVQIRDALSTSTFRPSLEEFEALQGVAGLERLLGAVLPVTSNDRHVPAFRNVLGPWIIGSVWRSGVSPKTCSACWQALFQWLLAQSEKHFEQASRIITDWAGPADFFVGDDSLVQEICTQRAVDFSQWQAEYCRAACATIFVADVDSEGDLSHAYRILIRLSDLAGTSRPLPPTIDIARLPVFNGDAAVLKNLETTDLQPDSFLDPSNILSTPNAESLHIVELLLHSAFTFASLGLHFTVLRIAKLQSRSDGAEQLDILQTLLNSVSRRSTQDELHWSRTREAILWLWSWGTASERLSQGLGRGPLGRIDRNALEKAIAEHMCAARQISLVSRIYLQPGDQTPLSKHDLEEIVVRLTMSAYDEASNGNKTRGSMKRAADLIAALKPNFARSIAIQRLDALIGATHAMSFYSLTLQAGVPFKPVNIRVKNDPVSLIAEILDQNNKAYTEVDNLVVIARNLVKSDFPDDVFAPVVDGLKKSHDLNTVERRVLAMAVESALAQDDFETAYSYAMNRLTRAQPESKNGAMSIPSDDFSWRAAYLAGRQRSKARHSTASISGGSNSPTVRRLEQRMELLSQALLLAPPTSLPEILAAWRRCEEELLMLLEQESKAERDFDDRADTRSSAPALPGTFGGLRDADMVVQPRRAELGRGAAQEAPMGLFDVMRGASAALRRTAYGTPGKSPRPAQGEFDDGDGEPGEPGSPLSARAQAGGRRRDMVANAVTGSLASGIGWVLGATPQREGG